MLGRINSNNEELKMFLKDEVHKLKEEVDLEFGDIMEMQKEHKGLQENVTNLEKTLKKQSHIMEEKNSEVWKQMSQHNETLNGLIVSVENHSISLHSLNVSIENHGSSLRSLIVSVENLSSSLRGLNVSVENNGNNLRSLNVSIENYGNSLRSLNLSLGNIDSNIRSLNISVEHHDINLRSLNLSVENHDSNLRSLDLSLGNIDVSLRSLIVSVENHGRNLHNLNVSVENHGRNLHNLNVSVENHGRNLHNLNVSVENHDSNLRILNVSVENHDSSLRNLNVSVENIACNISGLTVSVDILHSNMTDLSWNMTAISIETLVLDKRTGDIKENTFDKWSLTIVIMINTILLVLVIIYLVAIKHTNKHVSGIADSENQQANLDPAPYSTAGRILSQVRAHPRLERKLCVISFYEETHPLHMRMTQSVTQQLNMELLELTIRRHENILECPPVSLYFLFVDFNERNVILEDPTLGLGDLRLTTVQAVQKMGGRLVIFYVRDQNSRQLNPKKLYNEDLASVTRQRELSALNRLSRFISAYDHLTEFQKDHLRQIVVYELNSR